MEICNQSQLDLNFDSVEIESNDKSIQDPLTNKVIQLSSYLQTKENNRVAPIYQKILDSIKHIC